MKIMNQSKWKLYKNTGIEDDETRDEYVNRLLLNQVHNHKVIIRYLVLIIAGLAIHNS